MIATETVRTEMPTSAEHQPPECPSPDSPSPEFVSPEERDRRLASLREALLEGQPRHRLIELARQTWNVSRRTAQSYVHDLQKGLHEDAEVQPALFELELSQLQRNRFYQDLVTMVRRQENISLKDYCLAVATATKLLNSRDRTSALMLAHQGKQKNAESRQFMTDLNREIAELEEHDKTWREQWKESQQPKGVARPESSTGVSGSTLHQPDGKKGTEKKAFEFPKALFADLGRATPFEEDEEVNEDDLTEDEKEEVRLLDEAMAEDRQKRHEEFLRQVAAINAGSPLPRSQAPPAGKALEAEPRQERSLAATGNEKKESTAFTGPDFVCVVDANVLNAGGSSKRKLLSKRELRTDRKRKRHERKRLRRLRKRRVAPA